MSCKLIEIPFFSNRRMPSLERGKKICRLFFTKASTFSEQGVTVNVLWDHWYSFNWMECVDFVARILLARQKSVPFPSPVRKVCQNVSFFLLPPLLFFVSVSKVDSKGSIRVCDDTVRHVRGFLNFKWRLLRVIVEYVSIMIMKKKKNIVFHFFIHIYKYLYSGKYKSIMLDYIIIDFWRKKKYFSNNLYRVLFMKMITIDSFVDQVLEIILYYDWFSKEKKRYFSKVIYY